jgi:ketosteroid isomerase-like protein
MRSIFGVDQKDNLHRTGADPMHEAAESVAQAFIRAINRQDVDALVELMPEQHRFIDSLGTSYEGRETLRRGWTKYFAMVPDYTVAIEETYSDGPVVIMLGVAQGTYVPHGELKPENRWSTPTAFRAHIEDGKVSEWRVYCDNDPIRQRAAKAV